MNYDPNLNYCGRQTVQRVRLTFAMWEHRKVVETEVFGNCSGMSVIDCAVGRVYEDLPGDERHPEIVFESADEKLTCQDEEGKGEDWLKDMLISAEILSIAPRGRASHNA